MAPFAPGPNAEHRMRDDQPSCRAQARTTRHAHAWATTRGLDSGATMVRPAADWPLTRPPQAEREESARMGHRAKPWRTEADDARDAQDEARLDRVDVARRMLATMEQNTVTIPQPPAPTQDVTLPVTVFPTTAHKSRELRVDAREVSKINREVAAQFQVGQQTLDDVIRAANPARGSGTMLRVIVNGEMYQIAIVRPSTVEQAIHERRSVTGWMTLGSASDDFPAEGGTVRCAIRVDDPTPEGKIARESRDNKKLAVERGAIIRQIMREKGCSQEDAAHVADRRRWIPGVSQPIPADWTEPGGKVADEFKPFTGEAGTTAVRWAQAHQSWIDSLKGQVKAGSLTPVDATKLLKAWRDKHPQPATT